MQEDGKSYTTQPDPPSLNLEKLDLESIRALSLADKAFFAEWPLGFGVAKHQAAWLDLTDLYPYLLILAPADHGKTHTFSIANPIAEIARNRNIRIGLFSARDNLSEAILRQITGELENNIELIQNFGQFRPDVPKTWQASEIIVERDKNLKDPTIFTAGVMSSFQGRRFDLIICDDIADYLFNSLTKGQREKLRTWFFEIMLPTLEPNGKIIVVGTRQHEEDIYNDLIKSKLFFPVEQQAIINYDTKETLWPEHWTFEKLMERRKLNPVAFEKRYQNRCMSTNDIFADKETIRKKTLKTELTVRMELNDLERMQYQSIIVGLDPDVSLSSAAKYSAFCVIGITKDTNKRRFLYLDRQRCTYPELKAKARQLYMNFKPDLIMIEGNAFQEAMVQDMEQELPVRLVYTSFKKFNEDTGVPGLFALILNNQVELPGMSPGDLQISNLMIDEIYAWPSGQFSDMLMSWFVAEHGVREAAVKAECYVAPRQSKYSKLRRKWRSRFACNPTPLSG